MRIVEEVIDYLFGVLEELLPIGDDLVVLEFLKFNQFELQEKLLKFEELSVEVGVRDNVFVGGGFDHIDVLETKRDNGLDELREVLGCFV